MADTTFDWKALITTDPRYAAQDQRPERLAAGAPAESWKADVLAAYIRDDQLKESARDTQMKVGVVPALAAGLKLVGGALFGMKVGKEVQTRDLVLGPEEAALVIRDGRILGSYHQERLSHGAGFLGWLKGLVGDTPNYRILVADAAPFEVRLDFATDGSAHTLLTKDDQVLRGYMTARMQFDVEALEGLLGMFRGRTLLHIDQIGQQIRDAAFARVLVPLAREHLAQDIRGNQPLQDKVRGDITRELERMYSDVGLLVRDVTTSFDMTDAEKIDFDERRKDLVEGRQDRQADRDVKARKRDHERRMLEAELGVMESKIATKLELKEQADIARLAAGTELEQRKAELEMRKVELEIERLEAEQGLLLRKQRESIEHESLEKNLEITRKDEIARRDADARAEGTRMGAYTKLSAEQIRAIKGTPEASAPAPTPQNTPLAEAVANPASETSPCPNCGTAVESLWRACPSCGSRLS